MKNFLHRVQIADALGEATPVEHWFAMLQRGIGAKRRAERESIVETNFALSTALGRDGGLLVQVRRTENEAEFSRWDRRLAGASVIAIALVGAVWLRLNPSAPVEPPNGSGIVMPQPPPHWHPLGMACPTDAPPTTPKAAGKAKVAAKL